MEGEAKSLVREMMVSIETWVKEIVGEAETVTVAAATGAADRWNPTANNWVGGSKVPVPMCIGIGTKPPSTPWPRS